MDVLELSRNQVADESSAINDQYWSQCHQEFSEDKTNSMPLWLINAKNTVETSSEEFPNVDASPSNNSQRKGYEIVENNFRNDQEQLLMIMKGLAGSGKIFFINNIRFLLKQYFSVTTFLVSLHLMLSEKRYIL